MKQSTNKLIRRNNSLSPAVDNKVRATAESAGADERRFFEVAERFRSSDEPAEVEKAKRGLARMIYGA